MTVLPYYNFRGKENNLIILLANAPLRPIEEMFKEVESVAGACQHSFALCFMKKDRRYPFGSVLDETKQ